MNPETLFMRWIIEHGVINLLLMLCQALRTRHEHYAPGNSTFLAYAVAIEESLAGIERRKDELLEVQ